MKVHVLNKSASVFNVFLAELRNVNIQTDPLRFRTNIERMGEVIAYELSKSLTYSATEITTPLGTATETLPVEQPVVASVLRAGLPLHLGITRFFDRSENAFVSAFRIENADGSLDFKVEYNASPNLDGKVLILADPMLATGNSMYLAYKALLQHGTPSKVIIASVIGCPEGVSFLEDKFPENTELWIGAVDKGLNEQSYIVPGLGDAGDLAFGVKN